MRGNRGATSLKLAHRGRDAMRDFDRLPPALRVWLAGAVLPWGPRSARRAFKRALARTQDTGRALEELERRQRRLIEKDIPRIWGQGHPGMVHREDP
ncbi:MAG: DUF6525 family protein [Pseudomonadota bacterium]